MVTSISRRQFLTSTAAVGASALLPGSASTGSSNTPAGGTPNWNRVLILIELDGGNDGLNTVIPINVSEYNSLQYFSTTVRHGGGVARTADGW